MSFSPFMSMVEIMSTAVYVVAALREINCGFWLFRIGSKELSTVERPSLTVRVCSISALAAQMADDPPR